jgi:hypothetical protein
MITRFGIYIVVMRYLFIVGIVLFSSNIFLYRLYNGF